MYKSNFKCIGNYKMQRLYLMYVNNDETNSTTNHKSPIDLSQFLRMAMVLR